MYPVFGVTKRSRFIILMTYINPDRPFGLEQGVDSEPRRLRAADCDVKFEDPDQGEAVRHPELGHLILKGHSGLVLYTAE